MKNNIVKSVATVTICSIITRFLAFVFKVYISRKLGAEAVGIYQMALGIYFMLIGIASSGVPVVLSRIIAEDEKNNKNDTPSNFSSSLIITTSSALIIILIALLSRPIFENLLSDSRATTLLYIMLPALFSTAIYNVIRSWFWGKKHFLPFSFTEMLEEVLRISCTLLFCTGIFSTISNISGLAIGFLISDILCAIILTIFFVVSNGKLAKPTNIKSIFRSSLPITSTRVFSGITTTLSAIIIPYMLIRVGYDIGEASAMYGRVTGMAMPLLMAPSTIIGALSIVLIPEIATIKQDNTKSLLLKIESSILFTVCISAIFTIIFIPSGVNITSIIFDDTISGKILKYSALIIYPIGINQVTTSILNSLGQEKTTFIHFMIGSVFMLIALFVLPSIIGEYTFTASMGICFSITSILNLYAINKKTSIFDKSKKPVLAIVLSIPEILLGILLNRLDIINQYISLIVASSIPTILYILSIFAFNVLPKSIIFLHSSHKSC